MSDALIHHWYPQNPAIYDIHKTYLQNLQQGPFFHANLPKISRKPQHLWQDFLGYQIASPLGVPAGPLLSADWINLAAKLGFDVLTYKTIRSHAYPSHLLPNMIYVDPKNIVDEHCPLYRREDPPADIHRLSVTNSFGMPSMSPDFLAEDIAKAQQSLTSGQVMIVSVVGSESANRTFDEDFIHVASFAKEAGAQIIEANFSCPNILQAGGSLYLSPQAVYEMAKKIVQAIHPIPLILKVGNFPNKHLQKEVMIAASQAKVHAIQGINTLKRKVIDRHGNPALDEKRLFSGICGAIIRDTALQFLRWAREITREEGLDLAVMGVGGITDPNHFDQHLHEGPQIALSATGMMWDPFLAAKWHDKQHF